MSSNINVGDYVLASRLKGFVDRSGIETSNLRARVTRIEGDNVWIITADLRFPGVPLVLDLSQVSPIETYRDRILRHRDGLVSFA